MRRFSIPVFGAALIAAIMITISHVASAQQTAGDIAQWRFGILGGVNYNYVEAPLQRYIYIGSDPFFTARDYTKASEIVPFGGVFAEYIFNRVLGVGLRASYDDRTVSKEVGGSTITPRIGYIAIEPALRLNIYSGLHFNAGPSVNIPVRHVYDYTPVGNESGGPADDADLENMRDVSIGAWGGFGYDIPLNNGALRWYLTPFVEGSWLYDQKDADPALGNVEPDKKWTTLTARAGIQVKLGPASEATPAPAEPPVTSSMDVTIRTPRAGVLQPRDLIEHMPLVNYLFFDKDSTGIPARYTRLQPEEARGFDERRLAEQGITVGSAVLTLPEDRQLQVYYNMLNIFGERMATNSGTKIRLVGSAPDQKEGLAMAENVKSYLVNTFGIDAGRITTKGQVRPPHASGTRATPKEDLPLVAEENRRVEILTDDQQLLVPVQLQTDMREPVTNNLDVTLNPSSRVANWNVTITGEGFSKSYGPFHKVRQRINATPILGGRANGTYKAVITATMENGESITREATFSLKRTERPPLQADRYSILFEYDESKTVELYEQFLRRVVAPSLPENSMVYVHGHTDLIGDYDYNADLSMRRAETTMLILEDEIGKLNRDVTVDVYGFGENPDEMPFENESPEERHYNRTVVIDVFRMQ